MLPELSYHLNMNLLLDKKLDLMQVLSALEENQSINISLTKEQAYLLQVNVLKFYNYQKSKFDNPKSIISRLKGILWVLHRFYVEIKDKGTVGFFQFVVTIGN